MKLYLKESIQLVPYCWDWYAWSHLISPMTAAANIQERHLKIMESFIEMPSLHEEAIHMRGMIGGPFINLNSTYQDTIAKLFERTLHTCKDLLTLYQDVKQFNLLLQQEGHGMGLENLYNQLPISLKGMVELTYDAQSRPQMRFIEALFYKKYNPQLREEQSICLAETKDDNRPFSLSTPFVENNHTIKLQIPFISGVIDQLADMKIHPQSLDDVLNDIAIPTGQLDTVSSFFTDTPNKLRAKPISDNTLIVQYFGHACVLLQTKNISILIDPALGYSYENQLDDRYTYLDLPEKIDYVLITHNHQDHFLLESLLQIRHKIGTVIIPNNPAGSFLDPSLKLILNNLGFKNIIPLDEFDDVILPGNGKITGLPFLGEHGDLAILSKQSYYISINNRQFLFLADSNNVDNALYQHIHDNIGSVDTLFIGMECVGAPVSWLYGPLLLKPLSRESDRSRRLSGSHSEKAWEMINHFNPKEVYVYAMGMEPWLGYIMAIHYNEASLPIIESNKFIERCRKKNIIAKRLYGKQEWTYLEEKQCSIAF